MMGGPLHGDLAARVDEQRIRVAAVPHFHSLIAHVDGGQGGRHEAVRGQDGLELAVEFLGDRGQRKTFRGHTVEGLGQRHGGQRGSQAVAGGIRQQHIEHFAGRARGAQQIATEGVRRHVEVANHRVAQAGRVRQPAHHVGAQARLFFRFQAPVLQFLGVGLHFPLQGEDARIAVDLGAQDLRRGRLDEVIVAARFQAAHDVPHLVRRG